MDNRINYPVHNFVFEFAKEASKEMSFNDIHIKNTPYIDLDPVESYTNNYKSFFNINLKHNNNSDHNIQEPDTLPVNPIFFENTFDLKKAETFEKVFPKGCVHQKLFAEQLHAQLDTVQSLLLHSTDNYAYEFYQSFSSVRDIHKQLSNIIPQVKNTRNELRDLDKYAQIPQTILNISTKKRRLAEVRKLMCSIQKVKQSIPAAESLADNGDFEGAFSILDEVDGLLDSGLIGAKALRPFIDRLGKTKEMIGNKLKMEFFNILAGKNTEPTPVIHALQSHNLLDDAIIEATNSITNYSKEQTKAILIEESKHHEFSSILSSLSLHNFTDVLSYASHKIRTNILANNLKAVEIVNNELGIDIKYISQSCAESVFEEVTRLILNCSLKNATIEDINTMFDVILKFVRDIESFNVNKSRLFDTFYLFSQSFVEAFDCSRKVIISNSFIDEHWQRCAPTKEQLEFVRKLTANKEINSLAINGEPFCCSSSLLTLIEAVYEYIQIARIAKKTADNIAKKLSDIITMYSDAVLNDLINVEAVKSGRLKNISTKNLALAASNIEFLELLFLYLKPRMKVAGADQCLVDEMMKRVRVILLSCDEQLKRKILSVLLMKVSQRFEAANNENKPSGEYIEEIAKEVLVFHSVVSKYLPSHSAAAMARDVPVHIALFFENFLSRSRTKRQIAQDIQRLNDLIRETHMEVHIHQP